MTSLSESKLREHVRRLEQAQEAFAKHYPGEQGTRQPVHTVYGGAHLFKADAANKLGAIALRSLQEHAPDAATFAVQVQMLVNLRRRGDKFTIRFAHDRGVREMC